MKELRRLMSTIDRLIKRLRRCISNIKRLIKKVDRLIKELRRLMSGIKRSPLGHPGQKNCVNKVTKKPIPANRYRLYFIRRSEHSIQNISGIEVPHIFL